MGALRSRARPATWPSRLRGGFGRRSGAKRHGDAEVGRRWSRRAARRRPRRSRSWSRAAPGCSAVAADASRRAALANGATGLARFNGGAALIACHPLRRRGVAGLAARAESGLALVDYAALALRARTRASLRARGPGRRPAPPATSTRRSARGGAALAAPIRQTRPPPGYLHQLWTDAERDVRRLGVLRGAGALAADASPPSSGACARRARRAAPSSARRSPGPARSRSLRRPRRAVCASCASSNSLPVSTNAATGSSASYPQRGPIWSAQPRSAPTAKSSRRHSHFSQDPNSRRAQGAARRPVRGRRGVRLGAERARRRRLEGGTAVAVATIDRAKVERAFDFACERHADQSPLLAATSSSPTRSGSPRSAPGCGSTPRRSARRCSTTRSRTPARASTRSARSSARRSPSWSTASPS